MRARLLLLRPAGLVLALLLAGCLPDGLTDFDFRALQPPRPEPEPPETFARVAETQAEGLRLTLDVFGARSGAARAGFRQARLILTHADGRPAAGLTPTLHLDVLRDGRPVALPAPETAAIGADGMLRTALALVPLGEEARLSVRLPDGRAAMLSFPLAPDRRRAARAGDGPLWALWHAPDRPVVGENVVAIGLYEDRGEVVAPAPGRRTEWYPYMDMGGGDGHSTPFTTPSETAPGLWRSRVDFIMSGGWDLTVRAGEPGGPLRPAVFAGFTVYEP